MLLARQNQSAPDDFGQLLMIGLAGTKLNSEETQFLRQVQPAGVIYFRRNVHSIEQLRQLSQQVQITLKRKALIAVDEEGGRVSRLGHILTHFPAARTLGRALRHDGRTDLLTKQVRAQCNELRSVGINFNFAPVLDLDTHPDNPAIATRALSASSRQVARWGARMIQVYRRQGVVCAAKHFPGHGDTQVDSHIDLPRVSTRQSTLARRELVPFRAAIAARVPVVLASHVVYRSLDAKQPATFSHRILTELLRNKLGFAGVIASDDMEMGAITRHQPLAEAAVRAVAAGIDLLLVCESLDQSRRVIDALHGAWQSSADMRQRMRESISRVSKLKQTYGIRPAAKVKSVQNSLNLQSHRQLAARIEKVAKLC